MLINVNINLNFKFIKSTQIHEKKISKMQAYSVPQDAHFPDRIHLHSWVQVSAAAHSGWQWCFYGTCVSTWSM